MTFENEYRGAHCDHCVLNRVVRRFDPVPAGQEETNTKGWRAKDKLHAYMYMYIYIGRDQCIYKQETNTKANIRKTPIPRTGAPKRS